MYGQSGDDNITQIARIHGENPHIEVMMRDNQVAKEHDAWQKSRICYRCGDLLDDCCCPRNSDH